MNRLPAPRLPAWLEEMVPFRRYAVDVGGRAMHVMEHGEGLPVLLLHGNPTWSFLYRKVMHRLADAGLRLIAPDLLGLGLSDKLPGSWHSLDNHAEALRKLLEQLDIGPFVFVGQDWGGPIGVRVLAERPEWAAGLVLMNTVFGPPKPGFKPTPFHRFSQMPLVSDAAFRLFSFPQINLGMVQGDKRSIAGKVARAYRFPLSSLRRNAAPLALARMVPDSLEHPSVEPLGKCQTFVESFRGPAALVWGERDPILGRVLGRAERALPQAEVTRTKAGHFLQEEVPDEIAAAIRSVAARVG